MTMIDEMMEWLNEMPFDKWKTGEKGFRESLDKARQLAEQEREQKPKAPAGLVEIALKADIRVRYNMGIKEDCKTIFVRKEDLCV